MAKEIRRRRVLNEIDGVTPLMSRIYGARGIRSAAELDLSMQHLLPPENLKNIAEAASLLATTITEQRRILIVGDFDADGATSCALLVHGLKAMAANDVDFLVPSRFEFGYGLTPEIVDVAQQQYQPNLIVTVDNGISSVEGVETANQLGIQVLITDHHLAPDVLPAAAAIVNPNQPGCEFASKSLAGVGVAFYLLSVVRRQLEQRGWFEHRNKPNLAEYLDLVALGTIADVVPLDYNNRILVNEGLRRIRAGRCRPGILALLRLSQTRLDCIGSQDLAFFVAPRLNAAGRLEDMSLGIDCLLEDDAVVASELAARLDGLNVERREIEHEMKQQALATLKDLDVANPNETVGISLFDKDWHQGVVGLVAARIKDRFHRPVVAFASAGDGELKGSGRSIPGFHMRDAFAAIEAKHPGLLVKFGGHAMAAGLSLKAEDLSQFRQAFDAEAKRVLNDEALTATIQTDGEVESFTVQHARDIAMACPWGQGFSEPVFDGEFEIIEQRIVGGRHLKLRLRPVQSDELIDGIAFGEDSTVEGRFRHIAYRLGVNEYRGLESVQLVVESLGRSL